jgi:hypothetical protein
VAEVAPQECVLSPLLYSLFTYDCVVLHGQENNHSLFVTTKRSSFSWTTGNCREHASIAAVERVKSFKFLVVHITEDLKGSLHTDRRLKKSTAPGVTGLLSLVTWTVYVCQSEGEWAQQNIAVPLNAVW